MKQRAKRFIPFFAFAELLTVTVLIYFVIHLASLEREQRVMAKEHFDMVSYADELRQSSDDLTRFARTYVVSGDEKYKAHYYTVLGIRNGTALRPENYGGVYWDLMQQVREERHPAVNLVSLKELMSRLSYSEKEIEKLRLAETNSNALVAMEVQAFNAMVGSYKDSSGDYTIKGEPNQLVAINLLFSLDYHRAKHDIMLPIDEFMTLLNNRVSIEVGRLDKEKTRRFFAVFMVMALFLLEKGVSWFFFQRKIIHPIQYLMDGISLLGGGSQPVMKLFDVDEFDTLITNFFKLHSDIDERTQSLMLSKEELEKANVLLQEAARMKSTFIDSMSHELRTPLNSIIGFTSILLEGMSGPITDTQQAHLSHVYTSANHLLNLVTNVLDLTQIEAGQIDLYFENICLTDLINEAATCIAPQIEAKELTLDIMVPGDLHLISDRKRVLQCIVYYLDNSVKFTESGRISVEALQCDDKMNIMVKDTGIGIPDKDQPTLFQAFHRVESELLSKEGGAGLGLYMTHKIVTEYLGGDVFFESKLGKGSTFGLILPVHDNNASGH